MPRISKATKTSKQAILLPSTVPLLIWDIPSSTIVSKDFLKFSTPNNEAYSTSIPSIERHNINPEDLAPFNYSELKKYMDSQVGHTFINNTKKIQKINEHDFILQNENQFDEVKKEYMCLLDEKSCKIPSRISGIYTELTEFQRTSVAAMIEIEEKKCAEFYSDFHECKGVVNINAAVFSDPVGSGKTLSIETLIRIKPLPMAPGVKMTYDLRPIYVDDMSKYNTETRRNDDTGYRGYIKRSYKNIIPCTIIFAGVSVAKQWTNETEAFTNFKYLEIVDVRGVDQLMKLIENGDIRNYDLIIVKNGNVTREVGLPGNLKKEDKNKITTPYIYNIIGNLRNIAWARCIIDDFDNIQLPPNASIINACFTWYISSTTKILPISSLRNNQFYKTSDILIYDNVSCGSILRNQFLFSMFNVRNHPTFVENNNGLTNPIFYVGIYKNMDDRFTKLIDSFSSEETNELVQMLNSGAINTAAEMAGVSSKSAADIFETILGKKYAIYKKAVNVIKFIEKYDTDHEREMRLPAADIPSDVEHPDHTYTKEKLLSLKVPEYKYPNLGQIFRDVKEEQTEIYKATDLSLKRVKENIKSGNCPICSESISEIEGNIMICRKCSVTGCEDCITMACSFYPVDNTVKGRCPMCRVEIKITDMIHVSSNVELIDIVNDNFESKQPIVSINQPNTNNEEIYKPIDEHDTNDINKRTKITALIEIIKGKIPVEFKEVDIKLEQLQTGKRERIESGNPYKKILVFTSYEESIDNITKALNLRNISYWRLAGSAANINQISRKFNSHQGDSVLIINSSKHCAGLNLQTADWLIYFHKVKDYNVETQIAGRGQRIGRKSTLRIGYLLYQNEVTDINFI